MLTRQQFRALATIGPTLAGLVFPLVIFGFTNVVWSSVFGIGLCLGSFAQGGAWEGRWTALGLWSILLWPVILFYGSAIFWDRSSDGARKVAVWTLTASFFALFPVDVVWRLDQAGFHLPDLYLHLISFH